MSKNRLLCKHLSSDKKLVSVSTISLSVTKTNKEDYVPLERLSCFHYLIWFKKNEIQALIDLDSEVNAMTPAYASRLGLKVHHTDVGA